MSVRAITRGLLALGLICGAAATAMAADDVASVHAFLKGYLKDGDPATTKVAIAFADLNSDGANEVVAYVMGPDWCGSGGCDALVLTPEGSSFKVVMDASVSQLPISVLPARSHGWSDLGVAIGGGGGQSGIAEMKFDGKTYPDNPTAPPAKLLKGDGGGKILIPDSAEGDPLRPQATSLRFTGFPSEGVASSSKADLSRRWIAACRAGLVTLWPTRSVT
jgi:hypothetical protein